MTENTEPRPSSLCASTDPPSRVASWRDSARPRPVPRRRFWMGESTCEKSLNSRGRYSGAMPTPVSVTEKRIIPCPSVRAETRTSPWGVNLTALEM